MKAIAVSIGVVILSPFLLAGTAALAVSAQEAGVTASCDTAGSPINTTAVTKQVASILSGKGSAKDIHVVGLDLPDEQIPNAKTIVVTGISRGVPAKGQVIALATALQESRLRNLAYGDRDSLGLFQQRPSAGWGTPEQIRDPVYAATRFYEALLDVRGWQQMTIPQAAQAVQQSSYPDAYAKWEQLATALQKAIAATIPEAGSSAANNSSSAADACTPGESGSPFGPIPPGAVPKGYSIPAGTAPRAQVAIRWALQQLGTPYQWGGSCTAARGPDPMGRCDCSSLVQQAYAHAGVSLPRTTYTQVKKGKAVAVAHLEPGDLIFAEGSARAPDHVGMYIGEGLAIEAPHTGAVVRITPLTDWDVLAARRIV